MGTEQSKGIDGGVASVDLQCSATGKKSTSSKATSSTNVAHDQQPRRSLLPALLLRSSGTPSMPAPSTLAKLVLDRNWDGVSKRISSHPAEVTKPFHLSIYGTIRSLNPLHLACALDPPSDVVSAMIRAADGGAKKKKKRGGADGGGVAAAWMTNVVSNSRMVRKGVAASASAASASSNKGKSKDSNSRDKASTGEESLSASVGDSSSAESSIDPAALTVDSSAVAATEGPTSFGLEYSRATLTTLGSSMRSFGGSSSGSGGTGGNSAQGSPPLVDDREWDHELQQRPQQGGGKAVSAVPSSSSPATTPPPGMVDPSVNHLLPLHVAVLYRASPSVLEALLVRHPDAARCKDGNGYLPIHLVCAGASASLPSSIVASKTKRFSLKGHPRRPQDQQGEWDAARAVLLLLKAFPGSVHVPSSPSPSFSSAGATSKNAGGDGALSSATEEALTPLQYARQCLPDHTLEKDSIVELLTAGGRVSPLPTVMPGEEEEGAECLTRKRVVIQSFSTIVQSTTPAKTISRRSSFSKAGSYDPSKPTKLYDRIQKREWQAAGARLAKCPHEASVWTLMDAPESAALPSQLGGGGDCDTTMDDHGCHRLPLHRACALKPPLSIVQNLYRAFPEGISSREKYGMLPLHVACQSGAHPEVVKFLLHCDPSAAQTTDSFGLSPIHLACTEGASPGVIAALLRSYPDAAITKDGRGRTVLDYAKESRHPNRKDHLELLQREKGFWSAPSLQREPDHVPVLYELVWRKRWYEAISRARESDGTEEASSWVLDEEYSRDTPRLPLHLACQLRAPAGVVSALLDAHPHGASARERHGAVPLHVACEKGAYVETVNALLRACPEAAKLSDDFGLLPIHVACTEGAHMDVIEALLRAHPEAAVAKDRRGNTPLTYAEASRHPHKAALTESLKKDSSVWSTVTGDECDGTTISGLINRREWDHVIARLQDHPEEAGSPLPDGDCDEGELPIHRACALKPPRSLIRALLGAHSNGSRCRVENDCAALPLHVACMRGASVEVVESLLESYPDAAMVELLDGSKQLPVHLACLNGTTVGVLEALIRASPESVNQRDSRGHTPLAIVESSFHCNKVMLIDALERAIDDVDSSPTTLYELVARKDWVKVVSRVREHPSEASAWHIENGYGFGRLPIHLACALKPPRRVVAVLHNAYPQGIISKEKDDRTSLHVACQHSASLEIIQLLINVSPGAISCKDRYGLLPIHIACIEGASLEVIKVLLRAAPGSFAAKDKRGRTALEYAELTHPNHDRIVEELVSSSPSLRSNMLSSRSVPSNLVAVDNQFFMEENVDEQKIALNGSDLKRIAFAKTGSSKSARSLCSSSPPIAVIQ